MKSLDRRRILPLACLVASFGCSAPRHAGPPTHIRYVGSSTVAIFLREAEPVYGRARFEIDTGPESSGGERAIREGTTDLAGIAASPRPQTLRSGVAATLIGRDAIAVIVNPDNPIRELTLAQLRAIFAGEIQSWKELGGPDLEVRPFIVGAESATHEVFRAIVLGEEDYSGCEVVRPDGEVPSTVAATPGGIGQISFSFLDDATRPTAVAIEGESPTVTNLDYPISRPLYLLWREGRPAIEAFAEWTATDAGQQVVMRHFVGTRVVGSAGAGRAPEAFGWLVVYTRTFPVYDGGIYYYPHRPYSILTRRGDPLRQVRNHRGENDESPTRVKLPAGAYVIRTRSSSGDSIDLIATIEEGKTTTVDVEELLEERE